MATDMETVYVLRLRDGFWYVGKTTDFNKRLKEHQDGKGSKWTQKHPLDKVEEFEGVNKANSSGREQKKTAEFMLKHGVNRVRGGAFCRTQDFTIDDKDMLVTQIGHALDMKYKEVAEKLHDMLPPSLGCWGCQDCGASFASYNAAAMHDQSCQGPTGGGGAAMAKKTPGKRATQQCNEHTSKPTANKRQKSAASAQPPAPVADLCSRCGREGHTADKCYARSVAKGFKESADINDIIAAQAMAAAAAEIEKREAAKVFAMATAGFGGNFVMNSVAARAAQAYVECGGAMNNHGLGGYTVDGRDYNRGTPPPAPVADLCSRCGREGHTADKCYARSVAKGFKESADINDIIAAQAMAAAAAEIEKREAAKVFAMATAGFGGNFVMNSVAARAAQAYVECGGAMNNHGLGGNKVAVQTKKPAAKKEVPTKVPPSTPAELKCSRCWRGGHTADSCYARTTAKNTYIKN